ncbi:MAG TPA: hypothetical protein VGJ17_00890, partial [Candidatus Limnocylindrales bacterium]
MHPTQRLVSLPTHPLGRLAAGAMIAVLLAGCASGAAGFTYPPVAPGAASAAPTTAASAAASPASAAASPAASAAASPAASAGSSSAGSPAASSSPGTPAP